MKRRFVFIPAVLLVVLVSLSSCRRKVENELCGEIKTEEILENWKPISAEVKEGRICAGPHLADLLVIDYKSRKEGKLVQSQTLVDRWTTLMEKKLGFVKKVPWRAKGLFHSAVYVEKGDEKGDEKKHYQISVVPDSDQAHRVKVYSVRVHIEVIPQETKSAQTKDCAAAADNLLKLLKATLGEGNVFTGLLPGRGEFEELCKKEWSMDVTVCVKEAKDSAALRKCKYR